MTQDRITALEEAAKKATVFEGRHVMRYEHGGGRIALLDEPNRERILIADLYQEQDREYFALANPSAILSLISTIRDLERERDEARTKARELSDNDGCCEGCGSSMSMKDLRQRGAFSCCPERKMIGAKEWRRRFLRAEDDKAEAFKAGLMRAAEIAEATAEGFQKAAERSKTSSLITSFASNAETSANIAAVIRATVRRAEAKGSWG